MLGQASPRRCNLIQCQIPEWGEGAGEGQGLVPRLRKTTLELKAGCAAGQSNGQYNRMSVTNTKPVPRPWLTEHSPLHTLPSPWNSSLPSCNPSSRKHSLTPPGRAELTALCWNSMIRSKPTAGTLLSVCFQAAYHRTWHQQDEINDERRSKQAKWEMDKFSESRSH